MTSQDEINQAIFPTPTPSAEPVLATSMTSVMEFCGRIWNTPQLASLPINDLFTLKMQTGFKHEFIVVRSAQEYR